MRSIFTIGVFLMAVLLLVQGTPSDTAAAARSPIDFDAIDAQLQAAMKQHRLSGMSVAIVQDGEIVFAKGYGEARRGQPMTPDIPMVIGSTTKTFTALAVMQLVEAGKLDLDAPVKRYIPWFEVADPQSTETITLRHLLSHTSGLSDVNYDDRALPDDATLEDAVRDLVNAAPIAAPGKSWHYFNPGYATLGYLIEQASGQSYGDYVAEHIFRPLGMDHAFADPEQAAQAGLAQGHLALYGFPVSFDQPFPRYGLPEGYLMISANDMARYLAAIMNNGQTANGQIISPASLRKMFTPRPMPEHRTYGLGWEIDSYYGEPVIYHGGSNEAFKHEALFFPKQNLGLVIQINENHLGYELLAFPAIKNAVADIMLGEPVRQVASMPMTLFGYVALALLIVVAWTQAAGIVKLRNWPERYIAMPPGRRVWDVSRHFVIPAVILMVISMVAEDWLQRGFTFYYAMVMVPDMMLIALIGSLGDLVHGTVKFWIVVSGRAAKAATQRETQPAVNQTWRRTRPRSHSGQ